MIVRNGAMACKSVEKKYVNTIVRGSFHHGNLSIFLRQSTGRQCVLNCIAAIIHTNLVPLYKWTNINRNAILKCGDCIYNTLKRNHEFLQVSDVGDILKLLNKCFRLI